MAWARVTLWLGSWVGSALCFHRAVTADPSYYAPALALGLLAVAPVLREVWLRPAERSTLGLSAQGLRWKSWVDGRPTLRTVAWNDIVQVELVTPGRDQPVKGLRFALATSRGEPIEVSAEQAHRVGLSAALEAYLGPLDEAAMLAGLAARGAGRHVLWRRTVESTARATPALSGHFAGNAG